MVNRRRIDNHTDLVVGTHTSWREKRFIPRTPKDPTFNCRKCWDRGVIVTGTDTDDPWATTRTPCDCPTGKRYTDDADDS